MALLERSSALDQLHACYRQATSGQGQLVFVAGEMGIGKSALVERFAASIDANSPPIVTWCDGLATPLGPLFDIACQFGPELERLLAKQAPRATIFRAVESALTALPGIPVLVLEDAHWADEASLELVRFLGRRIGTLHALFIVTYRNDELSPNHPLRRVLGDLATASTTQRIVLSPLSVEAISILAVESQVNAVELHAFTGGNPFFATEILAAGTRLPISLQDAILGRASRLNAESREIVNAAAAIGAIVDPDLLAAVAERPIEAACDEALAVGLFQPDGRMIVFRHAAVRATILDAIPPTHSPRLHLRILASLRKQPGLNANASRLAFHAEHARDHTSAFTYALEAAHQATVFQSHREAADQYARALRCADDHDLAPSARADLFEARAYACYLTAKMPDAIAAQEEAANIRDTQGDRLGLGLNLRRLARYYTFAGRHDDAKDTVERMYAILQHFPDTAEFVLGCGYLAEWRLQAGNHDAAIALGERGLEIANHLNDPATTAHALITVGLIQFTSGADEGRKMLERGLDLALGIRHEEFVLRALTHLAQVSVAHRTMADAGKYTSAGLVYAQEHDLLIKEVLFGSMHLMVRLESGDWAGTILASDALIRHPAAVGWPMFRAHLALGLAKLRSGRASHDAFGHAMQQATLLDDPGAFAAVQTAQAETAWLAGRVTGIQDSLRSSRDAARAAGDIRTASELGLWAHRLGLPASDQFSAIEPYALEVNGNWLAAAAMWRSMGVPLEAARARSASLDETDLREALAEFERLAAIPDAARVARRLRSLGYRGISRGPRPSTRSNVALLTRREREVLAELAHGKSNDDIARHLYLSPKTIDHHVSAILAKLDVSNRHQAVDRAREAGLLPK